MINTMRIDFFKLKSNYLTESFVAQWAADVQYVLRHILSKSMYPKLTEEKDVEEETKVVIKGTTEDLQAFADVMDKEKTYALEYLDSGLGSEKLSDVKLELEQSIHNFEKETGLKWPLR